MTIAEAERFYEQDTRDYEIAKNKKFLKWLKETIANGYHCFIGVEELQELIDNIVKWYEIKYPERELEQFEGINNMKFQDIESISDVMDIRQLLFRLPHNQLSLMECGYRAKGLRQSPIYDNGKEVGMKNQIFMRINRKKADDEELPYFLLLADSMNGKVEKGYDVEEYLEDEESINLDGLLSIFRKKYSDELDFTELEESVYDHNIDIKLRNRVLQLVALKLLYSKNTVPERGYQRAKRFINEFNKQVGLIFFTNEIDKKMYKDYTDGRRENSMMKKVMDMNNEAKSIDNVIKIDKSKLAKSKYLTNSMLRKK